MTELCTNLNKVCVGRDYTAVIDPETGEPALKEVVTRGRKRGLDGHQGAVARALRDVGYGQTQIATLMNVSRGAVQTALGVRYAG